MSSRHLWVQFVFVYFFSSAQPHLIETIWDMVSVRYLVKRIIKSNKKSNHSKTVNFKLLVQCWFALGTHLLYFIIYFYSSTLARSYRFVVYYNCTILHLSHFTSEYHTTISLSTVNILLSLYLYSTVLFGFEFLRNRLNYFESVNQDLSECYWKNGWGYHVSSSLPYQKCQLILKVRLCIYRYFISINYISKARLGQQEPLIDNHLWFQIESHQPKRCFYLQYSS